MPAQLFWIIALSLIGFALSWVIYHAKEKGKPLVCPLREDCNKVIQSAYSHLFGIPNEVAGMLYYGIVILFSLLIWSGVSKILDAPLHMILFVIALAAGVMSIVLIGIQAFVLRAWCTYCLASAAVNIVIVLLEFRWV